MPPSGDDPPPPSPQGGRAARRRWSFAPASAPQRRRIDVKLFRRDEEVRDAAAAMTVPVGELGRGSYSAVGVVGAKNGENIGTLWRSAYQLGASLLFTVNARYPTQRTDTLKVPTRLPLMHFDDWNSFASSSPHGAVLVAVEMGGTPLEEFEHPERAVYVLGSEDTGLPKTVLEACHAHIALSSARYPSFNLAVAGSIILYDRLAKTNVAAARAAEASKGAGQSEARD